MDSGSESGSVTIEEDGNGLPMRKPTILFVINSLGGGGAERVMVTLLNHSANRLSEYRIHLVLLDREEMAYRPPPSIRLHQLDCSGSVVKGIVALRQLIARKRPDVVCSFLTRSNVVSYFASRGTGAALIMSERANTRVQLGGGARGLISRSLVRLSYPRADRIIAVSKGVAEDLNRHFHVSPQRVTTIYNPLDVQAIRRAASEDCGVAVEGPYIVAAGRLQPVKNFELLVRAFAKSRVPGKLVIAGEGPERPRLEALIQQLGLGGRVLLPGFVANPFPLVARAHIFALSSNSEGFPNAILEALALGVPVVATNCAYGPAEILAGTTAGEVRGLTETPGGFLSPVGDIDAFARALAIAATARDRLALKASEQVQQYSPDATTSRYWSVLESAAQARRR
jgi:N-acetylgalactosamine-N,N'-diacetylbacillosaminyl-diphospho-undecaprenol 4-alpha-N-acetylgalactosaminyltransferase